MAAGALVVDVPIVMHNADMTTARAFLIEALRRVADGGDIDDTELEAAVPDPLSLEDNEKISWEELSHWADDDDIRARDARYAAAKRERMLHCLAMLNANVG